MMKTYWEWHMVDGVVSGQVIRRNVVIALFFCNARQVVTNTFTTAVKNILETNIYFRRARNDLVILQMSLA